MWGERISGGRGEASRVGRRDCSMRRAVAKRRQVNTWDPWKEMPSETYSCPASKSAHLVVHLQVWHQVVRGREGADLSW